MKKILIFIIFLFFITLFYIIKYDIEKYSIENNNIDYLILNKNEVDFNKDIIWTFWTGNNELTNNRKKSLLNLVNNTDAYVILITPKNLDSFIVPNYPLHRAFKYLSLTHKSDYLRSYFMYHYGKGYSDIKETLGSWKEGFDNIKKYDNIWMIATREKFSIHVGFTEDKELYQMFIDNYTKLPQNGAYICKPYTPLHRDIMNEIHEILDKNIEILKQKEWPIRAKKEDNQGYPLYWTEICGSLMHKYALKYNEHILFEGLPGFSTNNYQ